MRTEGKEMEGIFLLLKPSGMTAHDVVEFVRKKLKMKRVGHTGTLDPLASGLMVLCLGRATRLAEFISELDKVYRFEMVLGIKTKTQDAEGEILEVRSTEGITAERLEKVLKNFIGEIEQVPPMLSAVHYQGKRLYELARKGLEVERPPRKVKIHRLTLLEWWEKPVKRALIEVHCSRGTYIRTLASDIGEALGCGAYQHFLVRTQVGPFKSEQALTLEEFGEAVLQGQWERYILSLDQGLPMLPTLVLTKLDVQRILNGMASVIGTIWGYPNLREDEMVRLYDQDQRFLGLGVVRRQGNLWICQPRKIFPPTS
ncbi:MAG: tRNA pseudouridine(55) synthase TruB [Armatimonadetes bacterium]|nr:tRNA pseudouridine(55) synthase TruB [Armatimonadota bacterium]MCX7967283.1 tRNA pseudouridine(55) synthase TruB [Armatimonadota bacterium]MDW8141909.1 tRNA pseudouridine(55) synthase TruB [Armatimonadota bacterium]